MQVEEHSLSTSFFDASVRGVNAYYKVKAYNAEGNGISPVVTSIAGSIYPTKAPTLPPTLPTSKPTLKPNSCLVKGTSCPPNPQNCCAGSCFKKGRNLKCA